MKCVVQTQMTWEIWTEEGHRGLRAMGARFVGGSLSMTGFGA